MNNIIINIICDLKFFKLNDVMNLKLINKEFFNSCKYLQSYLENLKFKNYFIHHMLFDYYCVNSFIHSFKINQKIDYFRELGELLFDEYYSYKNNKIK
jgi:hypothetical protein